MRIASKILVCTAAMAALFVGSALAAEQSTDGFTTANENSSVTYDSQKGAYAVSYEGDDLNAGGQYVLLVVKGTVNESGEATYSVGEDTIMYIDQTAASNGSVTFDTVIPKSTPDCIVLLGGSFDGAESPKMLGTLVGQSSAGATITGTVTSYNPKNAVTLELYTSGTTTDPVASGTIDAQSSGSGQVSQEFSIENVPAGTYDLKVSKDGHAVYWLTGIPVEDDLAIGNDISLLCGDVDGNGYINTLDVNSVLRVDTFNRAAGSAELAVADLNGDGYVNTLDINLILSQNNFNNGATTTTYGK